MSTFLRAVAMGSKFILGIFIARYLSPSDVGTFNLMSTTIDRGVMLAGMQFFLYANRELAAADDDHKGFVVRNQISFYSILYLIVLPLMLLTFAGGTLDWSLAVWFYAILVCDHISYEMVRVLMSSGEPIKANFIHTLRVGLWVYPVVALMLFNKDLRHLDSLWVAWLVFSLSSVLLSMYWVRGMGIVKALKKKTDWTWIKAGVGITLKYLPVTLTMVAFMMLDRYAIDILAPSTAETPARALVGAYGLYVMIANIIVTFPESGLVSVIQPKMIRAFREQNWAELDGLYRGLGINLLKITLACAIMAVVGLLGALYLFIKEPVYFQQLPAFFVVLLSAILNSMGMWPRNMLYAMNEDKLISWMSIGGLIPFVILVFSLTPFFGILGTAIALTAGWGTRFALGIHFAAKARRALAPAPG